MESSKVAADLIANGWAPVPLVGGAKRPDDDGWLKRTYTPDDFPPGCNFGVKNGAPSRWRVDVDLDAPEAVRAGQALLPLTGLIHGRPGKPSSHYWFTTPNAKSEQFKDLDNSVLLEIRSTGGQTVVPPSLHPSGEPITWVSERAPMELDVDELRRAVVTVAITALIARHWPSGGRHVAAGHLGGFLARCGFSAEQCERIVRTVCVIRQEQAWADDNGRFARESAEKHARGEKTTGAPSLKESFEHGDEIVARIYQWIGREGDDQIDQLNAEHFVAQLGKDMVVATEGDPIVFQTFTNFEQRYYNVYAGKKKLGKFWLEHPRRRSFRQVVFAPPPLVADPRDYNLWRGFAVVPDPSLGIAGCARFLEHLREVICDGIADHAEYVLDLLAVTVQQPGTPTGKALALRGPQGVGKSLFVNAFGRLFGRHFTTVSSRKHITGDFNAHLSGRVVVFADEAIWGGNRQDVGTLKRLITERTIIIERKGVDAHEERNCIHLFMATNEDWIFPAGDQERRGVILDVMRKMPRAYFNALVEEIESPSFAPSLLALLQARDISSGRWRERLDTQGLRDQQDLTADLPRQWWRMKLDEGVLGGEPHWPAQIDTEWCYQNYLDEMGTQRGAGYSHRGTRMEFVKKLKTFLPTGTEMRRRLVEVNVATYGPPVYKHLPRRVIVLPSLDACRHFYDRMTGTRSAWEEALSVRDRVPKQVLELAESEDEDDF